MDRRDQQHQWYDEFDAEAMTLTFGDDTVPAKYAVCGPCDGKGQHVNPSIDAHGISPEEFADDPDFREDYFSGRYDVPCAECAGQRVVPVVDTDRATPTEARRADRYEQDYYADQREQAHEREMGY